MAKPSDAVPGNDCPWKRVALAHLWKPQPDSHYSDAWFRLHFYVGSVPKDGLAMYVVAFNRTGRIFVNGQKVGDVGSMQEPFPLNWNRAQYVIMPPEALHAGSNEIEIQQRAYSTDMGWLAPVRIGDDYALRPLWQRRVFWQNDLVQVVGACTGTIGVLMLCVWLARRRTTMYFWFGCASLVWTAISLDYYASFAPISPHIWEQFIGSAQVLRPILMFVFVLRYCGVRRKRLETAMWAYFILGSICVFCDLASGNEISIWFIGVLAVSPYFLFVQVRVALRRRTSEGAMLAIAGLVQIGLSAYDLWLYSENTWTERLYLAHFGAPLYLVVVGMILIRQFIESLNAYEKLAAEIEIRFSEKAAELNSNLEQLLDSRRNEAVAVERVRIMSDMQEGIGAQLTSALEMVRTMNSHSAPEKTDERLVASILRESIEDLQLVIDLLEPVDHDLLTVLGTLRHRLQESLGRGGIELHWEPVDLPPLPKLTPHSVLSILRIVQEAFANCLKHSNATQITISTALIGNQGLDEMAQIRIVDNGNGIPENHRAGRGLLNMRRRAKSLGGQLTITSRVGRTEVLVAFPTHRPGLPELVTFAYSPATRSPP